jgi:hypothetical protein
MGGAVTGGSPSGGESGSGTGGVAAGGAGGAGGTASGGSSGNGGTSAVSDSGSGGNIAMGCSAHDYVICEDFESTAVGGTPDGWTKHGDASGVVDDEARHGTRSLRLGAIVSWERRIYNDASALGAAHWGRIFYKVELPVPDAFVHSTMVALFGSGPLSGPAEYRVVDTVKQAVNTPDIGSRHQFLYNVQPQSSGEFGRGTSYDWTFDGEWHCAEWHIDAAIQSYHFYYDGIEELGFEDGAGNYEDSDIPTSFSEVRVGWINYQEAPPGFVAWIDDIALDEERIGCDE